MAKVTIDEKQLQALLEGMERRIMASVEAVVAKALNGQEGKTEGCVCGMAGIAAFMGIGERQCQNLKRDGWFDGIIFRFGKSFAASKADLMSLKDRYAEAVKAQRSVSATKSRSMKRA